MRYLAIVMLALGFSATLPRASEPPGTLPTSLHGTRAGKAHWYGAEQGGFKSLTGVPIEELGCTDCHGATDADGEPYPAQYPGVRCVDCHATADNAVSEDRCYACHGRKALEAKRLGLPDVHRDAGMRCWDCHPAGDVHGDGEAYPSMLARGAVKAECGTCHPRAGLAAEHARHDPHDGAVHCTSCHSTTVISCYSCHFESQVSGRVKRAMKPLSGFLLLVNRDKDGSVYPATFQSLTYEGRSFVAYAPFTPHTTVREGRRCCDCHLRGGRFPNPAIAEYNRSCAIHLATWDEESRALRTIDGVVPLPADYADSVRMDFMVFDGDPAAPPGADAGPWSPLGSNTPDAVQMLYATPMSERQMAALGFATVSAAQETAGGDPPVRQQRHRHRGGRR
jgi:hypothetical protein